MSGVAAPLPHAAPINETNAVGPQRAAAGDQTTVNTTEEPLLYERMMDAHLRALDAHGPGL